MQKDKQRSTKHTYETEEGTNNNQLWQWCITRPFPHYCVDVKSENFKKVYNTETEKGENRKNDSNIE